MSVYTLLLVIILVCVAADVAADVSDCLKSSLPCNRLHQLQRLLPQLQSKLSRHEGQLQRQDEILSRQEALLKLQDEKLSHQDNVLQRQDAQLSQQDSLLRQLERLLHHQDLKLSQQTELVEQLRVEKARDSAELKTVKTRLEILLVTTDFSRTRKTFEAAQSEFNAEDSLVTARPYGELGAIVSEMSQQLKEMNADIKMLKSSNQVLKNTNLQQDQVIQEAQSSTFVHWGSSNCSNASQLIYSGIVGGSYMGYSGSAPDYLCLTMSPVFSNRSLPTYEDRSLLYGSEYRTFDAHNTTAPVCAVCRANLTTTIMIPGTNVCLPGWYPQYTGFLMADHLYDAAGSEFICVDSRLEGRNITESLREQNSKLLYFTTTRCGILPCGPYVDDKVVTCVVCSK